MVGNLQALKEECEKINPDSDKKHYGTTDVGASYQASYQANGHVAHEAVEIGKVDLTKTKKHSNQPGKFFSSIVDQHLDSIKLIFRGH